MLGLDLIGISWGDVGDAGKAAFPYIHATGKGIASAFGAGAAADALENVEQKQGWLPATSPAAAATVTSTAQNVAAAATPKLHPGVSPKVPAQPPPQSQPAAHSTDGKPASAPQHQQATLSTATIVVGVSVLGVIALILQRLWSTRG